ncbi:MAG: trigger factor [Lachnospiraceae bacterium]|nr:trigger factor [Lachnospiraceae bacterium]
MKKMRKISSILIVTMGLTLLSGCGKANSQKKLDKMIDKYSAYCTLGDYKGIEYNAVSTEITDEMINQQVDGLLSSYATTNNITSGTAKLGDTVNIDFVGSVDGVEFEGGNSGGAGYDLTLGSGTFIDDFEDQIVGHKVGDVFDVNATFPDDYTPNPDLAGADAVFEVTLNSIQEVVYPEYTDEFVASYTDASSIAEYEQQIRDNLTESYKTSDESTNKSTLITAVIDNATINEYPTQDMEKLIDSTIKDVEQYAQNYNTDLATYVTVYYGFSDEEEFREYISNMVESYMKEKIVICAIAKAEGITATDDEIKAKKQELMDSYGITDEDDLNDMYNEDDIIFYTLEEKVTDFLIENAVPATATDAE